MAGLCKRVGLAAKGKKGERGGRAAWALGLPSLSLARAVMDRRGGVGPRLGEAVAMWVRLSQEVCVKERGSVALRLEMRKRVRPSQGTAAQALGRAAAR